MNVIPFRQREPAKKEPERWMIIIEPDVSDRIEIKGNTIYICTSSIDRLSDHLEELKKEAVALYNQKMRKEVKTE